jgi:3-oxoacyl-[acyl-carrier-protein] synthase III
MWITGIATHLPEKIADNEYFGRITGKAPEWFLERTGIRERRRVSDGENTNTMAVHAARALSLQLDDPLTAVDFILGCSYTPWDTVGTLAHAVQRELGLSRARALYISSACSSVVSAVEIAAALIEAGRSKKVLVVAAEHNSLYARDDDPRCGHLWGDGAAALLLTASGRGAFEVIDVQTSGHGHVGMGTGGVYLRPRGEGLVMPFGKDVFVHACREMESSARAILGRNKMVPEDLRLLVPHQANKRIIDHVGQSLGIPGDRVACTVDKLGNTGCASTLISLQQHIAELHSGDIVLVTVFGGGYSGGSALLRRC